MKGKFKGCIQKIYLLCERSSGKRPTYRRHQLKHGYGIIDSHLNFDTINMLSKKDIVNGLPKLKYVKDQLCSSGELVVSPRPMDESIKSRPIHPLVALHRVVAGFENGCGSGRGEGWLENRTAEGGAFRGLEWRRGGPPAGRRACRVREGSMRWGLRLVTGEVWERETGGVGEMRCLGVGEYGRVESGEGAREECVGAGFVARGAGGQDSRGGCRGEASEEVWMVGREREREGCVA
ncbi:hypothetical protein Tco_1003534 [Tanacetum coccineum]|uniref:Uncharacterized protein n=1 Tax=Tanacetum coccineum TaxID=301880 RepID=A0ABQ5F9D1_9ASTR